MPLPRHGIWASVIGNQIYIPGGAAVEGLAPTRTNQIFTVIEAAAGTDFNADSHPDYVLYKASTRQTAIWYLNNNVFAGGAYGPTLPAGWSLTAP
jgi:hypothetical protein